jgi:hypothetical protein
MKARLLLLAVLASTASGDPLEDIQRLDREVSVATWTGDAVWFEENLAEEYVLITPSGEIRSKRDVIRGLVSPGLKMEPYEPTEVQVRIFGDTAIATGRIQQTFTLGRTRYRNDLRYTDVYVRRKARWLLVSAHTSAVK